MPKKSLYEQISSIVCRLEELCRENNIAVRVEMYNSGDKTEINFYLED